MNKDQVKVGMEEFVKRLESENRSSHDDPWVSEFIKHWQVILI
jgi:hypothetical protein